MKNIKRNPWTWVPSLYFAEGIPYVIVMVVSVIMYKRLGISNTDIALYTSWLYLPWVIKPLWSPIVDILKTKKSSLVLKQAEDDYRKLKKQYTSLSAPERRELRDMRKQLDEIKKKIDVWQGQHVPKSPLGKAMGYMTNNWAELTAFTKDAPVG